MAHKNSFDKIKSKTLVSTVTSLVPPNNNNVAHKPGVFIVTPNALGTLKVTDKVSKTVLATSLNFCPL